MPIYSYHRRSSIPHTPAIYHLQERGLFGWNDIYIGLSVDVHDRWNREGERRHRHLKLWRSHQQSMRLVVNPRWECNLKYWEALAIQQHRPQLNEQRPKPEKYLSFMVRLEQLWRALPGAIALAVVGYVVAARL